VPVRFRRPGCYPYRQRRQAGLLDAEAQCNTGLITAWLPRDLRGTGRRCSSRPEERRKRQKLSAAKSAAWAGRYAAVTLWETG